MSYKRAEDILPAEIIELIHNYVDGEYIYIPRTDNNRRDWGERTNIRRALDGRAQQLYAEYQHGHKSME